MKKLILVGLALVSQLSLVKAANAAQQSDEDIQCLSANETLTEVRDRVNEDNKLSKEELKGKKAK